MGTLPCQSLSQIATDTAQSESTSATSTRFGFPLSPLMRMETFFGAAERTVRQYFELEISKPAKFLNGTDYTVTWSQSLSPSDISSRLQDEESDTINQSDLIVFREV